MFEYFDVVGQIAEKLMIKKLRPLIQKIDEHFREREKIGWLKMVEKYCSNISIIGFNSSFYDINLLTDCGFIKEI